MKPSVEIFSQGEEVVNGQTVDSNAAWLSEKLWLMGFMVKRHSVVGDHLADLKALLLEISERTDCCICTGGLGPTVDDLTAQAVAEAFDRPLQFDPMALAQIERYFSCRNRGMAATNQKQAWFPQGAKRIDNPWGTAPGFSLQYHRCWFVFVPGVPSEMKHLFEESVANSLRERFSLQTDQWVTLHSVGIGESELQQKLDSIQLPTGVQLGFRATVDDVQTKLLFPACSSPQMQETTTRQVEEIIGDYIYAINHNSQHASALVEVIATLMDNKQLTLAIQESITQGLIAAKCVGQPWLLSANFNRCIAQLETTLNLELTDDLFKTGAAIAVALHQQERTNLVLVQLVAGNQQQKQDKQHTVILYNTLLTPEGNYFSRHSIAGTLQRKQNQAAVLALDFLRRYLQKKCP